MDNRKKLINVINDIIKEEESFRIKSEKLLPNKGQLMREHAFMAQKITSTHAHNRVRVVHDAIFKVHRKVLSEHHTLVKKCKMILERLELQDVPQKEIDFALKLYTERLKRLKNEDHLIELEQQKIILEHNQFMNSLESGQFPV